MKKISDMGMSAAGTLWRVSLTVGKCERINLQKSEGDAIKSLPKSI
jgi:hypothetical protein